MKTKLYIPLCVAALGLFGCGEDFLNREDLFTISTGSYYSTPSEINAGLAGAYSQLTTDGGSYNDIFVANLMSDDALGGGGTDNIDFKNTDAFTNTLSSQYEEVWRTFYAGIVRANLVIENIEKVTYDNEDDKNQAKGEALFLRAYYHFKLTQLFGPIPVKPSSAPAADVNSSYDEIYALIGADLKEAIAIMPAKAFQSIPVDRNGHATKWAAEALLARVYLFYTGYHGKTEIALTDGSTIKKADAIAALDDCIANSGHALVDDFRNLWPYASASDDTVALKAGDAAKIYPYAVNAKLKWEGDGNVETVFAIKFSVYANWSAEAGQEGNKYAIPLSYSNQFVLFSAARCQEFSSKVFPFGMGWGGGPASPNLVNAFETSDLRKMGTILDVTNPEEGLISQNYEWGKWDAQQETGYYQKKYTPINANSTFGVSGMYSVMWGAPYSYQLENMQDQVLIRFADVLLMAAELKEDVGLLNQTRVRAGLAPLGSYSLAALQQERRFELSFEGLRFYDILRWGIVEQELAKETGIKMFTSSLELVYNSSYRPETRGLLPIPESQIAISNGGLKQNAGW